MRKIERDMLRAVRQRTNWKRDNTEVQFYKDGTGAVYLYGNRIATVDARGNVEPDEHTFRVWPTVTTRSRLNALGIHATQRDHIPYLNGKAVT